MINKGKVLSLRKIKNVNFFTQNKLIFLMCALFLIGVLASVISYGKKINVFNWSDILNSFYIKRNSYKFLKILLRSLFNFLSVFVLLFISGTSVMGVGLVPVIIFISGFVSGGISSYLYAVYSLKGIAFNALIILPVSVIFFTVCFFAAKTSFEFSLDLSKITLKKVTGSIPIDFKAYCNKYLILTGITVFISLADSALSSLFIKLFKF